MVPIDRRRFVAMCGAPLAATAFLLTRAGHARAANAPKLLDDLTTAFNSESNAHARYIAFAKKADQEGYGGVASLFRAAARGADIHAKAHAEIIRKLGGTPVPAAAPLAIKATADNLRAALDGESYERDKMYPAFISDAIAAGNKEAIKDLKAAVAVAAEHTRLFTQAASNLASWRTARKFFVCQTCGLSVVVVDFSKCPICFSESSDFVEIV